MKPVSSPAHNQPEIPPVNDDTLQQFLGYHMKRAFNVIQADLSATLKPFDLRMLTYTALILICDNSGLSQTQLAAAMDIERPNLVVIVDELERRDLIVRERVPTDRRVYALKPTYAGMGLRDKAVTAVIAHEARLFNELDTKARLAMVATLSSIRNQHNT